MLAVVLHPTLVNLVAGGAITLAEQTKPGSAGLPSKDVTASMPCWE